VYLKTLIVHHRDGDHSNDDPRNLVAAHEKCHWNLHDAEERGAARARLGEELIDVESFI
jgi:hypothetical protein